MWLWSRKFFCIIWSFIQVCSYPLRCETKWLWKALSEYKISKWTSLTSPHLFSLLALSFLSLPSRDPVQLAGFKEICTEMSQRLALIGPADQISYPASRMSRTTCKAFSPVPSLQNWGGGNEAIVSQGPRWEFCHPQKSEAAEREEADREESKNLLLSPT